MRVQELIEIDHVDASPSVDAGLCPPMPDGYSAIGIRQISLDGHPENRRTPPVSSIRYGVDETAGHAADIHVQQ